MSRNSMLNWNIEFHFACMLCNDNNLKMAKIFKVAFPIFVFPPSHSHSQTHSFLISFFPLHLFYFYPLMVIPPSSSSFPPFMIILKYVTHRLCYLRSFRITFSPLKISELLSSVRVKPNS